MGIVTGPVCFRTGAWGWASHSDWKLVWAFGFGGSLALGGCRNGSSLVWLSYSRASRDRPREREACCDLSILSECL